MSGYFANFPLIYLQTPDGSNVIIRDFFRRVDVGAEFGDITVALIPYLIPLGETPEMTSNTFYGSPLYHWVILMVNDIVDTYEEWPLSQTSLNAKIADQYDDPNDIHHYIDTSNGYIIDFNIDNPNCVAVTNVEYETSLNDNKRFIRVLDAQYLSQFVSQFTTLIGE